MKLEPGMRSFLLPSLRGLSLSGVSLEYGVDDIMYAFNFSHLRCLKLRDCWRTNDVLDALTKAKPPVQLVSFELVYSGYYAEQDNLNPLRRFFLSFQGLESLFVFHAHPARDVWCSFAHHSSSLQSLVYHHETPDDNDLLLEKLFELRNLRRLGICYEPTVLVIKKGKQENFLPTRRLKKSSTDRILKALFPQTDQNKFQNPNSSPPQLAKSPRDEHRTRAWHPPGDIFRHIQTGGLGIWSRWPAIPGDFRIRGFLIWRSSSQSLVMPPPRRQWRSQQRVYRQLRHHDTTADISSIDTEGCQTMRNSARECEILGSLSRGSAAAPMRDSKKESWLPIYFLQKLWNNPNSGSSRQWISVDFDLAEKSNYLGIHFALI